MPDGVLLKSGLAADKAVTQGQHQNWRSQFNSAITWSNAPSPKLHYGSETLEIHMDPVRAKAIFKSHHPYQTPTIQQWNYIYMTQCIFILYERGSYERGLNENVCIIYTTESLNLSSHHTVTHLHASESYIEDPGAMHVSLPPRFMLPISYVTPRYMVSTSSPLDAISRYIPARYLLPYIVTVR